MTMSEIYGSTRLYAVLGDPVLQVRAPGLLNPVLAEMGLDAVVVPVYARSQDFADVVRALMRIGNLGGLLITVPHKAAVCALADEVGPNAALSGTANAMRQEPDGHWLAENFDGLGFVRGLAAAGYPARGKHVALVGAGGAGSAIAVALLLAGASRLSLDDRDRTRVSALVARLAHRWPQLITLSGPGDLQAADIVVNATPLGLRPGDSLPFDPLEARPDAVVADIVMNPHETALLRRAAAVGRSVHHGIHMLREQVPCYREFFGWRCDD